MFGTGGSEFFGITRKERDYGAAHAIQSIEMNKKPVIGTGSSAFHRGQNPKF